MTQKELSDKLGAMHLRFLDDEENYAKLLNEIMDYSDLIEDYGGAVVSALKEGLDNRERFLAMEKALSSRSIIIEKRKLAEGEKLSAADVEGQYHVVLCLDDDSRQVVHFKRKQEQILFITIALCAFKNGLVSNIFLSDDPAVEDAIIKLARMIYPTMKENRVDDMLFNLKPEVLFSESVQKMKAQLVKSANITKLPDEDMWFVPYIRRYGNCNVYKLRMPLTQIIYPEEMQSILDALPDVSNCMKGVVTEVKEFEEEGLKFSASDVNNIIKGAEAGNATEQLRLGACYMAGAGGLEQDFSQAREWFLKAAGKDNVDAMHMLATMYQQGYGVEASVSEAFSWWQKAANLGGAEGLFYLGACYGTGDVVKQDYKKAVELFKQASDMGYLDAAFQLGICYMHGFGVDKDIHEAVRLFDIAAKAGHDESANELGYIYDNGVDGISKSPDKAYEYYLIAAEQGHEEAMWYVTQYLLERAKTEDDFDKAMHWVYTAMEFGYYKNVMLAGIFYSNIKEAAAQDRAVSLLEEAVEHEVPMANLFLARMVLHDPDLSQEERDETALEYLLDGAEWGEEECIKAIKQRYPEVYKEHCDEWKETVDLGVYLKQLVNSMASDDDKELFLNLVDAYREHWDDKYLAEMSRQLSIHKPADDDNDDGRTERRIVIKRQPKAKGGYEVKFILANGKNITIDKLNENCLMLYLLTVICSFKSGYTTSMAKDEECRVVMRQLIRLVRRDDVSDKYLDSLIEKFMWYDTSDSGSNYYKQYSNTAKVDIKKAIGTKDNTEPYLFANRKIGSRKNLRVLNLGPQFIDLPDELLELAEKMPDAFDVLQRSDNQSDKPVLIE